MPNSRFEGEYEDPSTQEYSDQGISFAEDEELPEQKRNLKVVSPLGFEPAEALSPDQLDAYLARFSVLFLDEHSGRRGGIGACYLRRRNCCSMKSLSVIRSFPASRAFLNFMATALFRTSLH